MHPMQPLQRIQTTAEQETYVINGCVLEDSLTSQPPSASSSTTPSATIALALSTNIIRFYDARSTAFLFECREHTHSITDLISSPNQPHLLFSSQEDGGVLILDMRQAKPVHFITDSCYSGISCCSLSLSPSGNSLVVAKTGDLDIYDPRTWTPVRRIEAMHWEEVTRVRHISEDIICTAGEDLMINFIDTSASTLEDDILLQATRCGEVITRMSVFPALQRVGMVGSCENAYLYPFQSELKEARIERPSFSTYLVDWAVVGTELLLVSGVKDDDGNAGPISVSAWSSAEEGGAFLVRPSAPLPFVHRQLTRFALGCGDRLITGGEDGLLVYWGSGDGSSSSFTEGNRHGAGAGPHGYPAVSGSVRGGQKEKPAFPFKGATNNKAPFDSGRHEDRGSGNSYHARRKPY